MVMSLIGKLGKKEFQIGLKWLVWSGILAIITVGGWFFVVQKLLNPTLAPISVLATTAKKDNVEISINESGVVELQAQQSLNSPGDVTVDQVLVQIGDRVQAGQSLIMLRNPDGKTKELDIQSAINKQVITVNRNRQKVAEAEENLALSKQKLQSKELEIKRTIQKQLRNDNQLEIQQKQIDLEKSIQKLPENEANLATAQRKLQVSEKLFQRGFISEDELDTKKSDVRTAQSNLRDAQLAVNTSKISLQQAQITREQNQQKNIEDIQSLQSALKDFQSNLATAVSTLRNAEVDAQSSNLDMQGLETKKQTLEKELENNIITSPINGIVLNIKCNNGDGVGRGAELITVGDRSQELVKISLSTLNAAKVKLNQTARISVIGPEEQKFSGRVKKISLQAIGPDASKGSSGSSGSSGGQVGVPATVQLDEPSGKLIPGSQVSVEIVLARRENVVVLGTGGDSARWKIILCVGKRC